MKKKDLKSLRTKPVKDLQKMISEKKKEASDTYLKIKSGQEKNLKKVNNLRTDISQILTVIKEKEILEKENEMKGENK
jgi:ribosomal protein L29